MENFNESIAEILEVESVENDSELASFDAWDSLTILSIIAFCYSNYDAAVSAEDVKNSGTILDLKNLVESKM